MFSVLYIQLLFLSKVSILERSENTEGMTRELLVWY